MRRSHDRRVWQRKNRGTMLAYDDDVQYDGGARPSGAPRRPMAPPAAEPNGRGGAAGFRSAPDLFVGRPVKSK